MSLEERIGGIPLEREQRLDIGVKQLAFHGGSPIGTELR